MPLLVAVEPLLVAVEPLVAVNLNFSSAMACSKTTLPGGKYKGGMI